MQTLTLDKKIVKRIIKETLLVRVVCHGTLHVVEFLKETKAELHDCDCERV